MYTLITRSWPPRPPQPEDITVQGYTFTTFGRPLNNFTRTDPGLRELVKRCLAYDPRNRPGLRELLAIARLKVGKDPIPNDPHSEPNATVRNWVRAVIYNAPLPQEHDPDPDDPGSGIQDDDPMDLDYEP